jgi:hypothetical protein
MWHTRKIKARIAIAKAGLTRRKLFTLCFSKLDLYLSQAVLVVECHIWGTALYGAEIRALRKGDQKYLESSEMWCWRRMEKIGWTDRMKNEVLHRGKDERNILRTIHRRNVNAVRHILCRDCLLKHVFEGRIEGIIEVTERWGIRCKQLLDDLKGKRGCWKLNEEALDRTLWRTRLGRGCGPVLRQTKEWMNIRKKNY